ncbi:hypothetical protein [Neomegalonema sp.]|uniref:hypothetical protein n=1 Tax=Neomegalonema sp. TaxID=2039713 RepID=UPI00260DE5A6|nr:hypothetical protein [Neomegalonema sp.]MDD2869748.1 hypothetical protein [Neomegalonema sp.]
MTDLPKTTQFKATTSLACSIAMTHPDRFNEAVAAGHYPCAPKTIPGRARAFGVADVIALHSYQRFLNQGLSPARAGRKACEIRAFLEEYPDADQVYIIGTAFNDIDRLLPEFDPKEQLVSINSTQSISVIGLEVLNFHYLRERIVHEINEAALIVGGKE